VPTGAALSLLARLTAEEDRTSYDDKVSIVGVGTFRMGPDPALVA
jgi:hypothetical protein